MKKTFTILSVALLSLASLPSLAQFKLGVTVGVNTNTVGVKIDDSDFEDRFKDQVKGKVGYTIGLAAEYSFTDALSLQTGLLLANKGFKTEFSEDDFSSKSTTSISYLEIPLNLAYKINKFQIHAGPYVGVGLSGKSKSEDTEDGETDKDEETFKFKNTISEGDVDDLKDDEDYLRRTDFGLNLGVGYNVGPVLLSATYSKGLSNIFPSYEDDEDEDDDDFKLTNNRFSVNLTWFFNK